MAKKKKMTKAERKAHNATVAKHRKMHHAVMHGKK